MPTLKFKATLIFIALLVATSVTTAKADGPMQFERFQPCSGNSSLCAQQVLARGIIQIDSAAKLTNFLNQEAPNNQYFNPNPSIVFDSPGGSLAGGIALGRLIRSRKLDTFLAKEYTEEFLDANHSRGYRIRVVAKDAECASACFFAFIGGSVRTLADDAMLGVHQFSSTTNKIDESTSQATVTALAMYATEMGIDRKIIDIASITSPRIMHWIDTSDARKLRIDNTAPPLNDWNITADESGAPTIQVLQDLGPGRNVMLFLKKSHQGGAKLIIASNFALNKIETERLKYFPINRAPTIHITINGNQEIKLPLRDLWSLNKNQENNTTSFIITAPLTSRHINLLRSAKELKIHDGFSNSISDMSIATQLSTKNLAGGINLLLRAE